MTTATTTSVSSSPIYDVIKARIQRILSTHTVTTNNNNDSTHRDSLTLTELCREYERIYENEKLPYQELGYETLTRFLSSMRDIVRMDLTEWPARCYLRKISKSTNKQNPVIPPTVLSKDSSLPENQNRLQHSTDSAITYVNVKQDIINLIQKSTKEDNDGQPLTFTELCTQYEAEHHGRRLPFERLGHPTLRSLLESMWDAIRVDNRRCYLVNNTYNKKGKNKNKHRKD
ncbi:hypothetical protein I4U23_004260 [Adineta vaga]|nr:hypothetical protein I4U23_004260 [Adineta vaga]